MKRILLSLIFLATILNLQADEFAIMRENLRNKITLGDLNYNINNQEIKTYIANIANQAADYQEAMYNKPITCLWEDFPHLTQTPPYTPYHVHRSYQRLYIMAQAWAYPTSPLYKDESLLKDILRGLDFLYKVAYNENTPMVGNWWEWRIGIPYTYGYIVSILYEQLTPEQIKHYELGVQKHVRYFTENGNMTFANQASICRGLLLMGVLTGNKEDVESAIRNSQRAFCDETTLEERKAAQESYEDILLRQSTYQHSTVVWKKEGLYEDGTFIQHIAIPYIGTYGVEIIQIAADMSRIFENTSYQITQKVADVLPSWIEKTYLPAIYKGEMMLMFMGRGASRNPFTPATAVALDIFESVNWLPAEKKEQVYNELSNFVFRPGNDMNPIVVKPRLEKVKQMSEGRNAKSKNFNIVYAAGDRVIHQTDKFRLGIAMSSCRIGKYEAFVTVNKEENTRGWYTSDGMTYIYTDNEPSYDRYLNSADSYHLPGITVDLIPRVAEASGMILFHQIPNAPRWVGGVSLKDLYGVAGMQLATSASDLKAKKSWFMFDNEVVCIGADIHLSDDREVLTIIDNRRNDHTVEMDNATLPHYAYLEGSGGYYFPTPERVFVDIWPNGHTELFFSHGHAPKNETYEYVLLPASTKEQTIAYSANPDIKILANTDKVQAVCENNLNIIGANFWTKGKVATLTADGEASVMYQTQGDTVHISIADPTWKRESVTITLKGKYNLYQTEQKEQIKVVTKGGNTHIIVNTNDRMGMTNTAILVKK